MNKDVTGKQLCPEVFLQQAGAELLFGQDNLDIRITGKCFIFLRMQAAAARSSAKNFIENLASSHVKVP